MKSKLLYIALILTAASMSFAQKHILIDDFNAETAQVSFPEKVTLIKQKRAAQQAVNEQKFRTIISLDRRDSRNPDNRSLLSIEESRLRVGRSAFIGNACSISFGAKDWNAELAVIPSRHEDSFWNIKLVKKTRKLSEPGKQYLLFGVPYTEEFELVNAKSGTKMSMTCEDPCLRLKSTEAKEQRCEKTISEESLAILKKLGVSQLPEAKEFVATKTASKPHSEQKPIVKREPIVRVIH